MEPPAVLAVPWIRAYAADNAATLQRHMQVLGFEGDDAAIAQAQVGFWAGLRDADREAAVQGIADYRGRTQAALSSPGPMGLAHLTSPQAALHCVVISTDAAEARLQFTQMAARKIAYYEEMLALAWGTPAEAAAYAARRWPEQSECRGLAAAAMRTTRAELAAAITRARRARRAGGTPRRWRRRCFVHLCGGLLVQRTSKTTDTLRGIARCPLLRSPQAHQAAAQTA